MDPAVTDPNVREHRLLAAIVFTDVVGFSRLTSKNEARVYVALQRDMAIMTDLCRSHGGQVLNTMGDGMLMSFPSAVDAMACAIEMQRTIAAQAQSLPPAEILHHRIGVHLGDIIMKGDNVFGDGVNTAARLQSEARPDSIWFSGTVQKVIQNKLKFDSRYLGPRQFKNLGERIPVWEVPPIAEMRAQREIDASGLGGPVAQAEPEGARGGRAFFLVLASVFLLAAVVFMVSQIKPKAAAIVGPKPKQNTTVKPAVPNTNNTVETPIATPRLATPEAALTRVDQLKRSYDFTGIVQYLGTEGKVLPDATSQAEKYQKLSDLKTWVASEIDKSDPAFPITVTTPSGEVNIYGSPSGPQIQVNKGAVTSFDLSTVSAADFLAIAQALELRPGSQKPANLPELISLFRTEFAL